MIIVVGCHTNSEICSAIGYTPSSIVIACLAGDGVAVFWMIMGFFLFDSDYKKALTRTCKRIIFPMILYSMLMFLLGDFLSGNTCSLALWGNHSLDDFIDLVFNGILLWRPTAPYTAQFWYMYSYIIIILFFPALKGVVSFVKNKQQQLIMFFVIFVIFLINDIVMNEFVGFSHAPFNGAFGGALIVLIGYVVYSNKEVFEGKLLYGIVGLVAFFLINLFRSYIQWKAIEQYQSTYYLMWFTAYGILAAGSLVIFAYGLRNIINNKLIKAIIHHGGKLSFSVYFVHVIVIARLRNAGIIDRYLLSLINDNSPTLYIHIRMTALVLACSLIIAELYYWLKKGIFHIFKHKTNAT
ncbi:Acyltransferase family protein [Ruminococcaceae bacterium YRB3002]|nr:Acyltransferase family protein [Ruminococcaceae bacterium YRB3002]